METIPRSLLVAGTSKTHELRPADLSKAAEIEQAVVTAMNGSTG
jgi:hypothetical protein